MVIEHDQWKGLSIFVFWQALLETPRFLNRCSYKTLKSIADNLNFTFDFLNFNGKQNIF